MEHGGRPWHQCCRSVDWTWIYHALYRMGFWEAPRALVGVWTITRPTTK